MLFVKHILYIPLWLFLYEKHLAEGEPETNKSNRSRSSSEASSSSAPRGIFMFCGNRFLGHATLAAIGEERLKEGKIADALFCFQRAIDLKSDVGRYYKLRGDCHKAMEKSEEALADYSRAVKYDPCQDHRIILSRAFFDARNYESATTEMIASKHAGEIFELSNDLWYKRKIELAMDCLNALIDMKPDPIYYRQRGRYHWSLRDDAAAISDYQKVVEMEPENIADRRMLADVFISIKNYKKAVEVTIDSNNPREIHEMATRMESQMRYAEAALCYTDLLARSPYDVQYYRMRGQCYLRGNDWAAAISDYRQVITLMEPNSRVDRLNLIQVLIDAKKYDEALTELLILEDLDQILTVADKLVSRGEFFKALLFYNTVIQKNPFRGLFYRQRGTCYTKLKDKRMAVHDFYEAVKLEPHRAHDRELLRRALFDYGRIDEAFEEYLTILSDADIVQLGTEFSRYENFDAALYCFNVAISRAPSEARLALRADCLLRIGNFQQAIEEFRGLLIRNPNNKDYSASLRTALFRFQRLNEIPEGTLDLLNDTTLNDLANDFYSQAQLYETILCLNVAISKNPTVAQYFKRRGNCLKQLGDLESAMTDFSQVIVLTPHDKEARDILNDLLFDTGRFDELIEKTRGQTDIELSQLGGKFFAAKKYNEALLCFNEALLKYPKEVTYLRKRADCNWEMKKYDDAILDFMSVVEIKPSSVRYRTDLIDKLCAVGRHEEAEKFMAKGNAKDLRRQDKALFEASRARIEAMKELRQLNDTIDYVKRLITGHAERRIDQIKGEIEIEDLDTEAQSRVKEIEKDRDNYMLELTRAFGDFSSKKSGLDISSQTEIPLYLADQILLGELMLDPLTTLTGITYDRSSIVTYVKKYHKDPIIHEPLEEHQLRPNLALKEAAELWKQQNY